MIAQKPSVRCAIVHQITYSFGIGVTARAKAGAAPQMWVFHEIGVDCADYD
jgi:hypothetical protein